MEPYYDGYSHKDCRRRITICRVLAFGTDIALLALFRSVVLTISDEVYFPDAIAHVILSVVVAAIFLTKDGWFSGKSIGKAIFGVSVVDRKTGQPIHIGRSFLRNLPLMIPFAPLVMADQILHRKRERLGDRFSRTKVIRPPNQWASSEEG